MFVVAIPLTLKTLFRIVAPLQAKKVGKLGVTGEYLVCGRKAMVRKEKAPLMLDGHINQVPKLVAAFCDSGRRVFGMQIENDAGVGFFRPTLVALVIGFD